MSEATAPTTEAPALPSLDERLDSVFGPSEPAGEDGQPPPPAEGQASPAASVEPDALAKARADRKAKLAELNAKSRSAVDAKAAMKENEILRRKLAETEERTKAYATYVDPTKLTKEQFFALAQQNPELSPQDLGNWLREQMADPTAAAARAAKTAVDPQIAKLQEALDAANAKIDGFMQKQQTAAEQAQERAALEQFAGFTAQNAATSPLAARFLEQHGVEEFHALTMGAADALPPNAGPQALLDEIEDRLTELGKIYAAGPANQQRMQATTPRPNHAAAQAPTHVTNSLAQQRSGVVDGSAQLAKLSLIERANLAFNDT